MLGKKKPTKKTTQKKQNELIGKRKVASKKDAHLEYSVTQSSTHEHGYANTTHARSFAQKKKELETEQKEEQRREGFWNTVEQELDTIGEKITSPLKVKATRKRKKVVADHTSIRINKDTGPRSPYVLRLGELEKQSPIQGIARATSIPQEESKDPAALWLKEVERMRKVTASKYRLNVAKVKIDFVGKKGLSKRELHILEHGPYTFKKFLTQVVAFPKRAIVATLRWLFEFVLSIPLGFLLVVEVLLKMVDASHRGATKVARSINRAIALILEQTILGIISMIKGIIILPLKVISLMLLLIYRMMSSVGLLVLTIGNSVYEFFMSLATTLFTPSKKVYARLGTMALVALAITVPVKFIADAPGQVRKLEGEVLGATKAGFGSLYAIQDSVGQGEVIAAGMQWEQAEEHFAEARNTVESLNLVVRGLIQLSPQGKDGTNAIRAGEELSQAGALLTAALQPLLIEGVGNGTITDHITTVSNGLALATPHLSAARDYIEDIDVKHVPDSYQAQFSKAKVLLPSVLASLEEFLELTETLITILGGNGSMRYAVLFQNNNELRPAGGFIGSLALIEVVNGELVNMEIPGGGSYDFKGYLTEHVIAPKPLHLINPHWQLQDANWYPDWATSAEKVAWFLEKSGVTSVDGVVAIQATTFVKLLEVLGPIEFPEYDVVLNAENVLNEIQTEVEIGYDKTKNKPKEYIAELAPKIIEKMLASESAQLVDLLGLLGDEVAQKSMLIYFRNKELNNTFVERGWQPSILNTTSDYLSVVHANIGGGKTDGVIHEFWEQVVQIADDGTATAELTLSRTHTGDPEHVFQSANNVDYMRLYVPEGSELISFEGTKTPPASLFETPADYYSPDIELTAIEGRPSIDESTGTRITNEFNKTAFGNWLQVDPGNTLVTRIKYRLPFKIKPYDVLNPNVRNSYSLIIQKQVGARSVPYRVSLEYPSHWNVAWDKAVGGGKLKLLGPGLVSFEGDLSSDTGFGVLFK